jgi:transcriptional regulator with XRE-family HTH domain
MELLDKVRLIIGNKCESPSIFADEIGVPRSAISHLLNGRNRPSLDVVRKIVKRYPDLGTEWILDDEKMPVLSGGVKNSSSGGNRPNISQEPLYGKSLDLFSQEFDQQPSVQPNVNEKKTGMRKAVRVLIFFSDGTFEEYTGIDLP